MKRGDILDSIRDCGMTDTQILEELVRAMSEKEARENFEHICRMNGTEQLLDLANEIDEL